LQDFTIVCLCHYRYHWWWNEYRKKEWNNQNIIGINTGIIIYSFFCIHLVSNLLLDQIMLSIVSFEIFSITYTMFCSFFFSDLFAAAFKMLQLILFNSVRQPYVFSVQRSREYASRAPYKWSLSLSLSLSLPFFRTYYFAETWQPRPSPTVYVTFTYLISTGYRTVSWHASKTLSIHFPLLQQS